MLDVACRSPAVNQADIYRNGLSKMGISPLSPNLTNFGMSLGDQMAVVPGRILNPPKVAYAQGKEVEIRDSAWNLRGLRFHRGARLGNCLAIAISEGRFDFQSAQDPEFAKVRTIIAFLQMLQMKSDPSCSPFLSSRACVALAG